MSGMNVFGTNIAAGTDSQKINNSLDLNKINLNIGAGPGFDKVTFDSLLTNLKPHTIDRKQAPNKDYHAEQSPNKDYHAEQARRNQEYSDKDNAVDNRQDVTRSDQSNSNQEKSDKNIDPGNRGQAYSQEAVRQKSDHKDGNTEVESKESNIDSASINKVSAESVESKESQNAKGNAFKVGSLLSELANAKAGELTNGVENPEGEETVSKEGEQGRGQGLKDSALLYDVLVGKSAESVENSLSNGKETLGQAGVKAGDLLKGLINAKTVDDGKQQAGETVKGENVEGLSAGDMKTESSLKAGELFKATADQKTDGIQKELAGVGTMQTDADGEEPETEIDELIKKLDKNVTHDKKAEIRQEQNKENKLQDFINQKNIQETNNAKATISKVQPGMVENLFRESAVRPNVNTGTKAVSENTESNNVTLAGDISARGNGAKITAVNQTGNIAKPTAFADIVNKIVYVAKGDNKLGVTLDHKDLGQLNIKLSLDKGVVNIHINTADKVAREFVESNMQQIVESLSKNGVSVGGFSVGLKNHQNSEGFSNKNANKNDKAFSIDGIEQREYSKAAANVYSNNGRVSVFA